MLDKGSKLLIFFIFLVCSGFINHSKNHTYKSLFTITGQAQGTTYTIKYIHFSPIIDTLSIQLLLSDIDQSLSLYQSTSRIRQFNATQRSILVDEHLLKVVQTSLSVSAATDGCFDITSKPISTLWGFNAPLPKSIPSPKLLLETMRSVGFYHLSIRQDSLIKDNPNTKIDCDGIAQGYTVDKLSSLLRNNGITDFMVELGGEVFSSGKNLTGTDWIVGIEAPDKYAGDDHLISKKIGLSNTAVTTSGSMKKFRKLGNRYWSHVIDPRTGSPVDNGIVSVTVIAKNAITADAYDNAFMVMGVKKAFSMADSLKDMGLYIVYANKDGSLRDSSNLFFKRFLLN